MPRPHKSGHAHRTGLSSDHQAVNRWCTVSGQVPVPGNPAPGVFEPVRPCPVRVRAPPGVFLQVCVSRLPPVSFFRYCTAPVLTGTLPVQGTS